MRAHSLPATLFLRDAWAAAFPCSAEHGAELETGARYCTAQRHPRRLNCEVLYGHEPTKLTESQKNRVRKDLRSYVVCNCAPGKIVYNYVLVYDLLESCLKSNPNLSCCHPACVEQRRRVLCSMFYIFGNIYHIFSIFSSLFCTNPVLPLLVKFSRAWIILSAFSGLSAADPNLC